MNKKLFISGICFIVSMLVMCSEPADLLLCDFRLFVAWHVIVTTIAIMSAVIASEAIQEIVKEKSDKEKEANL